MKRKFRLATAKGRTAWILLVLALLSLPTSAVIAARTSLHGMDKTVPVKTTTKDGKIPDWEPPLDDFDNVPVTYNPVKGAVEQEKIPDGKFSPSAETANNDDLNPSSWPDSTTVKVIATWPTADTTTDCSGILISDNSILTAGHCVFTHNAAFCEGEESCWAEDLEILLYQGTDEQRSGFSQILTWTAWTKNRDYDYDLAGVRLEKDFGNLVGWLGFGYNLNISIFSNPNWEYTSFPADAMDPPITLDSISFTWIDDDEDHHLLYSESASEYGQSGAAAHSSEHSHIIHSVLSHHRDFDSTTTKTGHTRITPLKFFALYDWIRGFMDDSDFIIYLPFFAD